MFLQKYKIIALSAIVVSFAGCEKVQPTVYEIPKENQSSTKSVPSAQEKTRPFADSAKMEILPGMKEGANSLPEISYQVPESWKELEPSGIRKANFKIESDDGTAEITVLAFPGDVGGALANINRWRDQVGLDPVTLEDSTKLGEPYKIQDHKALYVKLEGESQSIFGAVLPFHGNTWFFKMMGDTLTVINNDEAMKQFLDSVQFENHAH